MCLKARLTQSFSRAAPTYDTYADVQSEAATCLIARLKDREYHEIFEVGCGTGFYTLKLAQKFVNSHILAVDISSGMVAEARIKLARYSRVRLEKADSEHLPAFISGPFDLITASGALHWFEDLEKTIQQYCRILSPSGSVFFALFGPNTLFELNKTLSVFDNRVCLPVNFFPKETTLQGFLSRAFNEWNVKELNLSRTYPDLLSLLRSLKNTGVAPRMKTGPFLRTRSGMLDIERSYKKHFGSIRATYQIFICEGFQSLNHQITKSLNHQITKSPNPQ
ncbi:MAG: methyltransferase domain-containing protein [Thermodesulfobacteriota bacterium]|nr:methyltransferase domain-containing protein [Thermodesulfobacteriota bacterium]